MLIKDKKGLVKRNLWRETGRSNINKNSESLIWVKRRIGSREAGKGKKINTLTGKHCFGGEKRRERWRTDRDRKREEK